MCVCGGGGGGGGGGMQAAQARVSPARGGKLPLGISGFACSSYIKSALVAGAEEIIFLIQQPKWRCSSMLWSMESITRH